MEVKVLKEGEREVELSLDSLTVASLIVHYLDSDPRVEFAGFRQEHPLEGDVKVFLRVKEGDAKKVLKEAVEKALSDVLDLREKMLSSLS